VIGTKGSRGRRSQSPDGFWPFPFKRRRDISWGALIPWGIEMEATKQRRWKHEHEQFASELGIENYIWRTNESKHQQEPSRIVPTKKALAKKKAASKKASISKSPPGSS
jgi:hypothetical protein